MGPKNDGKGPKLTQNNILQLCRESKPPVVTTRDLMDAFGVSQTTAYSKLTDLFEEGKLDRKKIGRSGYVFYIPGSAGCDEITDN